MKLNETIENTFVSDGIFKTLYNNNLIPWLTESSARLYDIDYYNNTSGEKTISVLYKKILDSSIENPLLYLAKIIALKYADNWEKLREALFSDYDPIENYSLNETETPNLEMSTTTKAKQKITTETNNDNYGFNSTLAQPVEKSSSTSSGDMDDNETASISRNTGQRTLIRKGNIGVTTSQQMIESEIVLREKNFASLIYKDVDSILCSKLYE